MDLRDDWTGPLAGAGFDPGVPTGWLAEGLLPYLTGAESDRFRAALTALSTPGSRLVFDHLDPRAADRPAIRETSAAIRHSAGAELSTMDDPAGWLAEDGWRAETHRIPDLGPRYCRPLPADGDVVAANVMVLTTAAR